MPKRTVNYVLNDPAVDKLSNLIEESTRSTKEGVRFFVEPASNTLSRALSKRHHIIFGRRGSGKSSLLHKVLTDARADRTPIVYVDMEAFKGHSYPDVLVSVLLSTFEEFKIWIDGVAVEPGSKQSFWRKLIGGTPTRAPIKDKRLSGTRAKIENAIADLYIILNSADEVERKSEHQASREKNTSIKGSISIGPSLSEVDSSLSSDTSQNYKKKIEEHYKHTKIASLNRAGFAGGRFV